MTGLQVAVLADDLTGANDTVVMFAQAGWPTYLLLDDAVAADEFGGDTALLAVGRTLDNRALPDDEAASVTEAAVRERRTDGVDRIYLKVDSTMRGSVRGQIRGALRAWRSAHDDAVAVVCPAYPQMGRQIVDGDLIVNGVPLPESPAGTDPLSPMRTARMSEIVPGAVAVPNDGDAGRLADAIAAAGSETVVVDARTEDDMAAVAAAVDRLGGRAVPIGSAGLARHLARTWLPRGATPEAASQGGGAGDRVLVAVSSLNAVSLEQLRNLLTDAGADGAEHVLPREVVEHPAAAAAWGGDGPGADGARVVAVRTSGRRVADTESMESAHAIADALATAVASAAAAGRFGALVLVGATAPAPCCVPWEPGRFASPAWPPRACPGARWWAATRPGSSP